MSYYEERGPRRARQIGYAGYYDSEDKPVAKTTLTPEQRESLLEHIGGRTLQATEGLLGIVDTPASWLRDIVAGRPLGSGTTPGGLLDALGARPSKESLGGWARPLAEFAVGAGLDPLNAIGLGTVTRGGAALKALRTADGVNLLDDAARIASRRLIQTGDTGSAFAQNAAKSWKENFGKNLDELTDADLLARPIAGPRQTKRMLNVEDVVGAQPDSARLIDEFDKLKIAKGSSFEDLKKSPLAYDIGIGFPFSDHVRIGFNLPGSMGLAKGMDRVGQILRWSGPGRYAHAAFNRDTFGATDEAGQVVGKEVADSLRQGEAIGRRKAADVLNQMDNPYTADIGASMRRVLDNVPEPQDLQLLQSRPDLQKFVDMWRGTGNSPGMAEDYLRRRAEAGMASMPLQDRFGGSYFPRHVENLNFLEKIRKEGPKNAASQGRAFTAHTGDQMQRLKALQTPGGTDFINKLSLDSNVAGPNRTLVTDDDAAKYIKQQVDQEIARRFPGPKSKRALANGQPVPAYTIGQARKVARILRELDPKAVEAGLPMFGSHFTDDFQRYVVGNEKGIALNKTLFDLLGSTAKNIPAGQVSGGQHVAMPAALRRLGLRTINTATPNASPLVQQIGAAPEVLARLQARFPGQVADLKNVSLDKGMLDKLTRIADFYDYPEAQGAVMKFFDDMTRLWKGSILSWPARYNRDWYSGAFSNYIEVGNSSDLMKGYYASKALQQGQFDNLDQVLVQIPKYAGMTKSARKREFLNDVAAGGLLSGKRTTDMAESAADISGGGRVADEFSPGSNPTTTLYRQAVDMLSGDAPVPAANASYAELGKGWNVKDFFSVDRNPILKWGQKVGDITDSHNRIAGFVGLLLQGIDPLEAASRIKSAHVDYSSLTAMERETLRRIMPFWAYTSRMGKYVAGKIFERPGGRYTQLGIRLPSTILGSDDEEYVPESIRGSYGAAVPSMFARPFGGTQEGVTPWITDIDLPGIDQINMLKLGYKPSGNLDLTQTAFNSMKDAVGKNFHPWFKSGLEQLTGENFYTKRPLKDFTPAISQLAEDLPYGLGIPEKSPYGQAIKAASPLLDALPFVPRVLQISNRLLDSDKVPDIRDRAYQLGVNAFSGVKFQNVDDRARRIDARKKIAEILEQDPLVRSMQQVYVPEEAEPFVSPEVLQMMALDRQLGREAKREADIRAGKRAKPRRTDPTSYFE